jgi:hypothetical protein
LGGETTGDNGTGVVATTLVVFGLSVAFFFVGAGVLSFLATGIVATVAFLAGEVATAVLFFFGEAVSFWGNTFAPDFFKVAAEIEDGAFLAVVGSALVFFSAEIRKDPASP